jgi:hypothetical protein
LTQEFPQTMRIRAAKIEELTPKPRARALSPRQLAALQREEEIRKALARLKSDEDVIALELDPAGGLGPGPPGDAVHRLRKSRKLSDLSDALIEIHNLLSDLYGQAGNNAKRDEHQKAAVDMRTRLNEQKYNSKQSGA